MDYHVGFLLQIFDLFFGGAGRRRRGAQGKRKGEDIESPIKVTLEQIYNGATRKMAIGKDVICDCCDGLGGPKETITDCDLCNGTVTTITLDDDYSSQHVTVSFSQFCISVLRCSLLS